MFLVLLQLFLFGAGTAFVDDQDEPTIDCFVPGRCDDGQIVGFAGEILYSDDCLTFCQNTTNCNYFSYQPADYICIAYEDCANVSTDGCPDCISGHSNCSHIPCFQPEKCNGAFVDIKPLPNQEDCRQACITDEDCMFFTYDKGQSICSMTGDCQLDASCSQCVYGARDCEVVNSGLTRLLITSGYDCTLDTSDSEILDMAHPDRDCEDPPNYPLIVTAPVAALVNKLPWVCGGYVVKQCFNHDGYTNTWQAAASMLEGRYYAAATTLNSGTEWWITGGRKGSETVADNYLDTTEFLQNGEFVYGPDLPDGLAYHCLVAINNSHVFLAGGRMRSTLAATSLAYIINLEDGLGWQSIPDMSIPRNLHMCHLIKTDQYGDEIVVVGGSGPTTEILNVGNMTWRVGPSFPIPIEQASTVDFEDSFLLIGGYSNAARKCQDEIYTFNKAEWKWDKRSSTLAIPRCQFAAIMLPDEMTSCE